MTGKLKTDGLERLWLQQLYIEFEEICMRFNLHLRVPIFEISNTKRQLGSWCPETRILRLSSHLIVNHSWAVTLQVLQHEMAHQLCSELFQSVGTPHDETFQRACELLGVLPEYRHAGTEVAEMSDPDLSGSKISNTGWKCLARVEKLLALSQSPNEHEAALAMQKANELIEKYHLEQLSNEHQCSYCFGIIDRKRKIIEAYQKRICTILQDFFYVRVVLANLYDPLADDTHKIIELIGTRENVTIAEYCYHFLENQLALLWSQNRQRFKGSARTEKNSYYLGLLSGFYQKLQEQKMGRVELRQRPKMGELIVAEEQRLDTYVGMRYPRLRKAPKSGTKVYGKTYSEAVETGRTITFNQGLAGNKQPFGGLLPG